MKDFIKKIKELLHLSKEESLIWQLNKKGELMKELGGHEKYKKYRKREISGDKKDI